MYIGIDVQSANKEKKTGVEWYAYHLIEHMKAHSLSPQDHVFLYSPSVLREDLAKLPEQWEEKILRWPIRRGWMQARVSWEMFRRPVNILFVPGQGLPRLVPHKKEKQQATITTIHDLGFLRFPHLYPSSVRRRLEWITKRAIKKATHFLVPSEFTKQEVLDLYGISEERITVTPEAQEKRYRPLSLQELLPVLQNYRLGRKNYFFVVGRLEKKKNSSLLIRAFEQFKQKRGTGDPIELVFAGTPGYEFSFIQSLYQRSPFKEHIHFLGWTAQEDLPALMSGAVAFLFPSWYEGFGVPNLEALSCGTPLLTSDIPVHREVVNDAGIFLSPEDPLPWAQAMETIVENPNLQKDLMEKGLKQAEQFSWEKTADLTWKTIFSLL